MSGILVGPAVIRAGEPDWEANRAIVRAMRAEIARIRTPIGFGFTPERLTDLITDGVRTVLLCGEDGDVTPERTWQDLSRWLPVIDAHPEVRWIIELGNEPDIAGVDIWRHRYDALQTLRRLPQALGRPQLQWAVSLPCNLAQTRDLLARDEHGCILDHVDAICAHVYGWYDLGDGGGGDWLRILDLAVDTGRPVFISEAGIDDRATPRPEKARRYLRWLETAPAGIAGVCFWGLGIWEDNPTYELTREMAEVLATRHAATPAPPPPAVPPTEDNMLYGIRGLIDRRGELPRNPNGGPGTRVPLNQKRGVVIHYNGPPVPNHTDSAAAWRQVVNDAHYHIAKDWDEDPTNGRVLSGDGLMYHIAIGPAGEKWLCRDIESVLWHCGAWPHNATALSILVPLGGDQRATREQLLALAEVCDDWLHQGRGTAARDVWGHQELQPTSCPGTLMTDFVLPYRAGTIWDEIRARTKREEQPMADGRYFPETGHYVGHGFWEYWRDHGGLMIFGYPLTDEIEEPDPKAPGGKRVVQYFERAVFEYHPENDPPYRVLLRRLGAEALARKQQANRNPF